MLNACDSMNSIKFYNSFRKGVVDGIPIGLGYLSVSVAFGLSAVSGGLDAVWAILISMTNLTSAGQLAGLGIIFAGGSLVEMALAQLVINIRYALMSISLSQKMHKSVTLADRFLIAFGNTDEIFAVSSAKNGELGKRYMLGLILAPYIGWTLGTVIGTAAGHTLPESFVSALGIAIYAMLVAVFVPPMKKSFSVASVVAVSVVLSCLFKYLPYLKGVPSGYAMIICAVASALYGAAVHPLQDESFEKEDK